MDQRVQFIAEYQRDMFDVADLARRYGISRKTAYKWIDRYAAAGPAGLVDPSRRPVHSPQATSATIVAALLELRARHPTWGAKKLLKVFGKRQPTWGLPARSTVCDQLDRAGLITTSRRRPLPAHPGRPLIPMTAPNGTWTADFKGQFKTRHGIYCYPLTIVDGFSRYLLVCQGLLSTAMAGARPIFLHLFQEYGLPGIIRTDNGVPFATRGIHGLSQLNVWWLRLGIQHQRTRPASPQENGAHERMHKTLKAEAIRPPRATLAPQQRAFNRFRAEYNHERPHQFLESARPASRYRASTRPYPSPPPPIEYPGHFIVKRITNAGTFRFKKKLLFIANALKQHTIGLEEVADGIWSIHFCRVLLGRFDERDYVIRG